MAFRIADDNDLLLIDLKDLQKMLQFIRRQPQEFITRYGNISPPASVPYNGTDAAGEPKGPTSSSVRSGNNRFHPDGTGQRSNQYFSRR